jgi:hypothetical protein
MLDQADLTLELLPLRLGGEEHAAPKITLIPPSAHLHQNLSHDDHLIGVPAALALLGVTSSSDVG